MSSRSTYVARPLTPLYDHDAHPRALPQTSPTTHFDLFSFRKASAWPLGVVPGQPGWDARIEAGQAVLKGCVYKKR